MRNMTVIVVLFSLIAAAAQPAAATLNFQKVFKANYLDKHEDEKYAEFVAKKVKCYLCHQGKKSKKNRNKYGQQLSKLLDAKKDKGKDDESKKKIAAALEKVGKMPSNPKDKKSPTFAELIGKSELPGGKLDDLKKEPPKKDEDSEGESKEAEKKE